MLDEQHDESVPQELDFLHVGPAEQIPELLAQGSEGRQLLAAGNVQQALKELFPQLSVGEPAKRHKKASRKAPNPAVKY